MRVKFFTSKGPLNGIHGKIQIRRGMHGDTYITQKATQTLEDEISYWLAQNPEINVREIRQSVASRWFGRSLCVVSVWYDSPKLMLTRQAAEQLVLDYVTGPRNRETVSITEVIERPFGWVFCYNSKRFIETGDDKHMMLGNYPVLVDRHTCTLHSTGLGKIEDYIERYERTGQTKD